MRPRNNGKSADNIAQNQFTAYLMTAIQRRKITYLKARARLEQHEVTTDFTDNLLGESRPLAQTADYASVLGNISLERALEQIEERERLILYARVLNGQDFESLAAEWGLTYKGVTSVYYRLLRKIRREMGGDVK